MYLLLFYHCDVTALVFSIHKHTYIHTNSNRMPKWGETVVVFSSRCIHKCFKIDHSLNIFLYRQQYWRAQYVWAVKKMFNFNTEWVSIAWWKFLTHISQTQYFRCFLRLLLLFIYTVCLLIEATFFSFQQKSQCIKWFAFDQIKDRHGYWFHH